MFDVDEIMDHYEKVIKNDDPKKLLGEFDANLSDDYPFWRASFGRADEALRDLEYLREGLQEIDELCEKLSARGKLDWALSLVDSVPALKPEIEEFLAHSDQEEFQLRWQIETKHRLGKLKFAHGKVGSRDQTVIETKHNRVVEFYEYRSKSTRPIMAKDVMNNIYRSLREYMDSVVLAD